MYKIRLCYKIKLATGRFIMTRKLYVRLNKDEYDKVSILMNILSDDYLTILSISTTNDRKLVNSEDTRIIHMLLDSISDHDVKEVSKDILSNFKSDKKKNGKKRYTICDYYPEYTFDLVDNKIYRTYIYQYEFIIERYNVKS